MISDLEVTRLGEEPPEEEPLPRLPGGQSRCRLTLGQHIAHQTLLLDGPVQA